jgi:hypothetical protein
LVAQSIPGENQKVVIELIHVAYEVEGFLAVRGSPNRFEGGSCGIPRVSMQNVPRFFFEVFEDLSGVVKDTASQLNSRGRPHDAQFRKKILPPHAKTRRDLG